MILARRRRHSAFVLLEVLVALVILGLAFLAVLRGLFMGLRAMKEVRINEQAVFLAESLTEDFDLESPNEGKWEGNFSTDEERYGTGFEAFSYEVEVTEVDVRYRYKAKGTPRSDQEPLYEATIRIFHTEGESDPKMRFAIKTYLPEFGLFSDQAIQANQLF